MKDKQRCACRALNRSIQCYDPCTRDRISDWIYLYEAIGVRRRPFYRAINDRGR